MKPEELKARTKSFCIRIIKMTAFFPKSIEAKIITGQIIRCSTSVAANYRAACRAKSPADFHAKIKIVEEESDETMFWLELIEELELIETKRLENLLREANELTAIFTASAITSQKSKQRASIK